MDLLYTFISTVSPLGVIAILAIIIFQLVDGKKLLSTIRGTQQDREGVQTATVVTLATLSHQIQQIAGNHLHELPDMRNDISSIKTSIEKISTEQIAQGNRLTRCETLLTK